MTVPDDAPILGNLYVFPIAPHPDGTTRTAVWRPRGNPSRRILYYEGVTYLDNGREGPDWRGIRPFYEGGHLVAEATLADNVPHLKDEENAVYVISNTWGPVIRRHFVTNQADLDTPLFHPEDWRDHPSGK